MIQKIKRKKRPKKEKEEPRIREEELNGQESPLGLTDLFYCRPNAAGTPLVWLMFDLRGGKRLTEAGAQQSATHLLAGHDGSKQVEQAALQTVLQVLTLLEAL